MEPNTGAGRRETSPSTVSQSEVESLVAQVGGGDSPASDVAPLTREHQPAAKSAEKYHFREQSSLSANELRKLRLRHDEFIRSLAARLSIHLRLEVALRMSRLETVHFGKFIEGISNPTFLAMFQLEPLQGVCLLDIPPRLGLCLVNRELGGPGQCLEDARPTSEIESRLLSRIVEIIMGEWCSFWRDLLDLRPALLGHESNGDFVQACPRDTMVLVLGVEVQIGELSGQVQFCFPVATLDSLLVKLNSEIKTTASGVACPATTPKWNPALDHVKIKITAKVPNLQLTAGELANLKPGNVLMLTQGTISQARIYLAKKPKFLATVGTQNGRWAAKIVEPLPD